MDLEAALAASTTELIRYLALAAVAVSCSHRPLAAVYSSAEVDQALAGVKALRARCYAGSAAARAGRPATFEFSVQVEESGEVRAVPTFADPEEPALIECLRHGLNDLRFPPRGRDRFDLRLELGPPSATPVFGAARVANPSPL